MVLDHVLPAATLVRRLLDKPPATTTALVRILNQLAYVVLTPEDNRRLHDAGVGAHLAEGSRDPWDRYRFAGIDPSVLCPIVDEE